MSLSASARAVLDRNAANLQLVTAGALRPSVEPDIAAWAEGNFRLTSEDSAAPGLVVLEPWQREVLRAWQTGKITVVAASSQVGKTVLGLIIAAFSVRFRSGPSRLVHENDVAALAFAQSRVAPMIDTNLGDLKVKATRGRGSQSLRKFSNSSSLSIVGANTPAGLSSSPVRTLVATEVRGFPISTGSGVRASGDPLTMALARGKSFADFRAYIESSPGIAGKCRLTEALKAGDYRKWNLPCPRCGCFAPLEYDPQPGCHSVYFQRGKPETAAIKCGHCGEHWSSSERLDAIRAGEFRATKAADNPDYVSFQYSELESSRSELADIVRRIEESRVSTERQQAAHNTILGRPFDIEENGGIEVADETLARSILRYNAAQILPNGVLLATAGVDVQPDRLEIQVLGHGEGRNRWSLEYKVIPGNPGGEDVWNQLSDYLQRARFRHPSGAEIKISAACIDSGGHHTQEVYAFSASALSRGRAWYAIKGVPGNRPVSRRSTSTFLRPGQEHRLVLLGVDTIKNTIFDALQADGDEGRIYFPSDYAKPFFDGVTAEKRVVTHDKKGVQQIVFRKHKRDARNEPLDTLGYAIAAFHLISPAPDFASIRRGLSAETTETDNDPFSTLRAMANGSHPNQKRSQFP